MSSLIFDTMFLTGPHRPWGRFPLAGVGVGASRPKQKHGKNPPTLAGRFTNILPVASVSFRNYLEFYTELGDTEKGAKAFPKANARFPFGLLRERHWLRMERSLRVTITRSAITCGGDVGFPLIAVFPKTRKLTTRQHTKNPASSEPRKESQRRQEH